MDPGPLGLISTSCPSLSLARSNGQVHRWQDFFLSDIRHCNIEVPRLWTVAYDDERQNQSHSLPSSPCSVQKCWMYQMHQCPVPLANPPVNRPVASVIGVPCTHVTRQVKTDQTQAVLKGELRWQPCLLRLVLSHTVLSTNGNQNSGTSVLSQAEC